MEADAKRLREAPPSRIQVLHLDLLFLIGEAEAKGYIPENVRKTVDEFYIKAGADKFFSSKAEMINGRAAMVGFAALLALDIIF